MKTFQSFSSEIRNYSSTTLRFDITKFRTWHGDTIPEMGAVALVFQTHSQVSPVVAVLMWSQYFVAARNSTMGQVPAG